MHLRSLLHRLPGELARLSSSYAAQSRPHASLEPHPTLPLLLAHLKRASMDPSRSELIASLLRIHQAHPQSVWSTILLQVFRPTVRRLRKQLGGVDGEALDEILVEAFFETLARVPTHDGRRIFMYVRQDLRRRTFKRLAEAAAWQQVGFGVDADLEEDPSTAGEPLLVGIWLRGHGSRPEQAELLATLVDRGGLHALVSRQYPGLDELGRARAYRCLQKRRQRLVAHLRHQLRAERSAEGVSA